MFVKKRLTHCFTIELGEKDLNRPIEAPYYSLWSGYAVFPNNDKIKIELQHYQKYILEHKKYEVISRLDSVPLIRSKNQN